MHSIQRPVEEVSTVAEDNIVYVFIVFTYTDREHLSTYTCLKCSCTCICTFYDVYIGNKSVIECYKT